MINNDVAGKIQVLGTQPQAIRSARNLKNLPVITKTLKDYTKSINPANYLSNFASF